MLRVILRALTYSGCFKREDIMNYDHNICNWRTWDNFVLLLNLFSAQGSAYADWEHEINSVRSAFYVISVWKPNNKFKKKWLPPSSLFGCEKLTGA